MCWKTEKRKPLLDPARFYPVLEKIALFAISSKKRKKKKYLQISKIPTERHQIGGLILHPAYRKSNYSLGLQISLARFLYMKTFPKDFSSLIDVSLTGPIKEKQNHFWDETGKLHLKKSYLSAKQIFQKDRVSFFSSFPKKLKIPLDQLSDQAKTYLTKVHPQTLPAYKGLLKKGFYKTNFYHLLDGRNLSGSSLEKIGFF